MSPGSKKAAKKAVKKAAGKKAAVRKTAKKKAAKKTGGRLRPARDKIGLGAADMVLSVDDPQVAGVRAEVERAGGAVVGAYREPLSGRPMILASLPLKKVQPTPFQRDLSPTHTKRLAQKIVESGSFLDPLIVVRGEDGRLWTPNGRHRLAAAKLLGLQQITALISPDESLAFRILALNTEKAHNLKDRSLEVIRMARSLASSRPRSKETDWQDHFEAAEFLTLGIIYEQGGRFAGSAYSPFLKKVDRFIPRTLPVALRQRQDYADRLLAIDALVGDIVEELKGRGFRSPYLKTYVVARINPVRFHRAKKGETEPPMSMKEALTRMMAAARRFDPASVSQRDLAVVAALS